MKKCMLYALSALMGLGLILGSTGTWAAATVCGSVSMEATSPASPGSIDCQASGPDNITLQGGGYNLSPNSPGVTFGSIPSYTTILADADSGTDGDFNFTPGASVGTFTIGQLLGIPGIYFAR